MELKMVAIRTGESSFVAVVVFAVAMLNSERFQCRLGGRGGNVRGAPS